jgi:hypothetical protein
MAMPNGSVRLEQGQGTLPEAVVAVIASCLVEEGPPAVRHVRLLSEALAMMADACMAKDHGGLEDASDDACEALEKILERADFKALS